MGFAALAGPQCNSGQHTAFGRAIELGDDQTGELQCLVKGFDLRQRILSGVAVDDQKDFMRRRADALTAGLGDGAFDFFELFHQVQLRGQTAGGVHQHHIFAAGLTGTDRVEAH